MGAHTEESLAGAAVLDNLDHAGLQLLNGRDVVGQDTHISRLGGDVDLDDALRRIDGLCAAYILARLAMATAEYDGEGKGSHS